MLRHVNSNSLFKPGTVWYPTVNMVVMKLLTVLSVLTCLGPQDISATISPKIERIAEIPDLVLGEGPHWDCNSGNLYFVDIYGNAIHRYNPQTKRHSKADVGDMVTVIVPVRGTDDKFIIGLRNKICIVTWDGYSSNVSKIEEIVEVEAGTLLNDGKSDPTGRLWIGTAGGDISSFRGSLYTLTKKALKARVSQVGLSNGVAINLFLTKLYHADTVKGTIDQFDLDIIRGSLSNRKTIFTFSKHGLAVNTTNLNDFVGPDGMTIDISGNLWVAAFNGYKLLHINPRVPETLLDTITFPAKQVTSAAFGGRFLNELFVTTGEYDLYTGKPGNHSSGTIYRITGLNTFGLPASEYAS